MSVNKAIIVGRLGNDPEMRFTGSGSAVATFSVATSEKWNKDGQQLERTEWHKITAFGKLAEIIGQYLKKGSQVYIEGSIKTDKYTDSSGIERYSTGIIARGVQFLDSKQESKPQTNGFQSNSFEKDDLPF